MLTQLHFITSTEVPVTVLTWNIMILRINLNDVYLTLENMIPITFTESEIILVSHIITESYL